MVQTYHPKPISFVPPLLRRKFVAPDNPREMGALVMIVGLAILVVSVWSLVSDGIKSYGARAADGQLVATAPFRSGNAQRMVGVYVFRDEAAAPVAVRGNRVYLKKAKVPKTAQIVWPRGRATQAQVVGEYGDYLLCAPIGIGIMGFGLWLRRKRKDVQAPTPST